MAKEEENPFHEAMGKLNNLIEDKFRLAQQKKLKEQEILKEQDELEAKTVAKTNAAVDQKKKTDAENIQFIQDLYFELLGDVNEIFLITSKGKVGPVLNKNINEMINKLIDVRKKVARMNTNIDGQTRTRILNTKRKLDMMVTTQVIPVISNRDKTMTERYTNKYKLTK